MNEPSGFDLGWLVGRTLASVESHGHGTWRFVFGDDARVHADCPWRVIRDGGIVLSSEDHGHQYGLPAPVDAGAECRALIAGHVARLAEIRADTRDTAIVFESGTRLEVIPLSAGYESWQVAGPGRRVVIAQGGGNLAVWSHGFSPVTDPPDGGAAPDSPTR